MAFGDAFKAEPSILKLPDFVLLLFHIRVCTLFASTGKFITKSLFGLCFGFDLKKFCNC